MDSRSFRSLPMGFVAHRMYSAGVNPPIIEIKQGAHSERVIDCFICIPHLVKCLNIRRCNRRRIEIYLSDEAKESFLFSRQRRCLGVFQDARD